MKILLNDILNFSEEDLQKIKIRFNKSNNSDFEPIKLFKENKKGLYVVAEIILYVSIKLKGSD
ncbi:MAG: hypothetical protein KBA47_01560 [Caldisericia bacterium]|nr:hypothetical protein [Caldisericia bacterium]